MKQARIHIELIALAVLHDMGIRAAANYLCGKGYPLQETLDLLLNTRVRPVRL